MFNNKYETNNLILLSRMEGSVEQKHLKHMSTLEGNLNSSARLRFKWDSGHAWILCMWAGPGGGIEIRYIFIKSCKTGVFQS